MHEATSEPLSPRDREEILIDLEDLEVFQTLLEPRGVRGVVVDCLDCEAPHYFEWELLRANLRHLLDAGGTRVHEPAFDPDPADYVSWEYAQGFADGVLDSAEHEDDETADSDGNGNRNGSHRTSAEPPDPGDAVARDPGSEGPINLR